MMSSVATDLMQEPILLPGVPQCVVTRQFAYEWLKLCGYSCGTRGFGSLDWLVFGAPASEEPLSSYPAWAPLLDAVEAEIRGVVIVHVYGARQLPPRLDGVWRFEVPQRALPTFTRAALLEWLTSAQSAVRVYDLSAVHPDGTRIDWAKRSSAAAYLGSLPERV